MKKLIALSLLLISCNTEESRIHKMISLEAKYSLKYPETYESKSFTKLELVPANFFYTLEGKKQRDSMISVETHLEFQQREFEFDSTQLDNMKNSSYSLQYEKEMMIDNENKMASESKTIDSLKTIYLSLKDKYKSDSSECAKQQWYSITHFFNGKNAFGVPVQSIGMFYLNLTKDSIIHKSVM
ncbi:MAG: hypothetical protein ABI763_01055 [Bacteroidota bacterium]